MNTIFIGIAGGTGSGKTTLTEHLAHRFGDEISVVHHDNYYKRQDRPFAERCLQNYDQPDAFETERMVEDLHDFIDGRGEHMINSLCTTIHLSKDEKQAYFGDVLAQMK